MLITLLGPVAESVNCQSAAPSRITHSNFQCCLSPAITEARALSGPGHLMRDANFLQRPWAMQFNLNVATEMILAFVTDTRTTSETLLTQLFLNSSQYK